MSQNAVENNLNKYTRPLASHAPLPRLPRVIKNLKKLFNLLRIQNIKKKHIINISYTQRGKKMEGERKQWPPLHIYSSERKSWRELERKKESVDEWMERWWEMEIERAKCLPESREVTLLQVSISQGGSAHCPQSQGVKERKSERKREFKSARVQEWKSERV